jgi:hypothetical protein
MAWSLPDKGEGDNDLQSILFQEYLDALVAGINGIDCVLSGCAITGGADMTPAVAKGAVLTNGVLKPVTGADVTIGTADATNPRIDLIVVDSSGAKQVRAGTAAANPKPPARTANDVVLGAVYVPANDTSIESSKITDLRVMRTQGPITIYKTTAAETTNTTSAAIQALNKANSGVTIPNGLFTADKMLRVRMGGNMLLNSTTPTVRVVIAYGGTTMFSDISAASTGDADRAAWALDFTITAQGNADQALTGLLSSGVIAAKTAPTTGIGDAWNTATNTVPVAGSAAVNSDAADCLLSVQFTFSVSNALNELVVESASVELV